MIVGAELSMPNQSRYALAPATELHENVTGDDTVAPFTGDVSAIVPLPHAGADVTMNFVAVDRVEQLALKIVLMAAR